MQDTIVVTDSQRDQMLRRFRSDKKFRAAVVHTAKAALGQKSKKRGKQKTSFLESSLSLTMQLGAILYDIGSYEAFLVDTDRSWYRVDGKWISSIETELGKIWVDGFPTPIIGRASPILASFDPDISRWEAEGAAGLDYFMFAIVLPNAESALEVGSYVSISRAALAGVERIRIRVPLDLPIAEVEPQLPTGPSN